MIVEVLFCLKVVVIGAILICFVCMQRVEIDLNVENGDENY